MKAIPRSRVTITAAVVALTASFTAMYFAVLWSQSRSDLLEARTQAIEARSLVRDTGRLLSSTAIIRRGLGPNIETWRVQADEHGMTAGVDLVSEWEPGDGEVYQMLEEALSEGQ